METYVLISGAPDIMMRPLDANVDPTRSPWAFRCFVWVLLTLARAMIGPFTTYTVFGFGERLVYWAVICAVAVMLGIGIREVVETWRGGESLRTDFLVTVAQSSIIGPVVWLINHGVYGLDVWSIASFAEHVGAVLAAGLLVTALREQFRMAREPVSAVEVGVGDLADTDAKADAEAMPEFLSLVEETQRGPIQRISADDHYLHVVTTKGSSRILMRFRDALAQIGDLPGYRIHRSHWVAAARLLRVRPEGRRYVAELNCGTELPVSRAYLDDLRRGGYLD